MQVFIKITPPSGSAVGPNFSIVPNIGTSSPSNASLVQLTSGITVTLSNPSAISVTITSLGTCGTTFVINLSATTTTTSSSTTTTTTVFSCDEDCYKLVNTSTSPRTVFYGNCTPTNTSTASITLQPIGTAGSIAYICSAIYPLFNPSFVSISVPGDIGFDEVNCPCSNLAVVVDRPCTSPFNIIFDKIENEYGVNSLNGPIELSSILSGIGYSFNVCYDNSIYFNICDFTCQPLFLLSRTVKNSLTQSLSFGPGCYNPTLGNCCWISAQSSSNTNDYCQEGGVTVIDLSTTTTTTIQCYTCEDPSCNSLGVTMTSNCDENEFPLFSSFYGGPFSDGIAYLESALTPSDYQSILNLEIFESGDYSFNRSILKDLCELLINTYNVSETILYQYLNVILTQGIIITRTGFGSCNFNFYSAQSYLNSIEISCPTTTTTTSSSSTTTTTTCFCNAWDITISQTDLDNATFEQDEEGNPIPGYVTVSFKNCNSTFDEIIFGVAGSYPSSICSCCTPSLWYFDGENYIESTLSTATSTVIDCSLTTTTTVLPCNCISITGVGDDCPNSEGTYTDCDGNTQNYFLPFSQTDIICAPVIPGTPSQILDLVQTSGEIEIDFEYGDNLLTEELLDEYYRNCPCAGTTTTTTSTSSTTTTTTCNCFVTSIIAVNTDCGDCQEKLPAAVKYTICEGIQVMEQVPSGIITTLSACAISGSITAVTGSAIKGIQEGNPCCNQIEEE